MDLTDEQWAVLDPLIGEQPRRRDKRTDNGRPWCGSREAVTGAICNWIALLHYMGIAHRQ